jgi:competence protein ComEA
MNNKKVGPNKEAVVSIESVGSRTKLTERIGIIVFCLVLFCAGILLVQGKDKPVTFVPGSQNTAQTAEKTAKEETEKKSVKSAIATSPKEKTSINKASIEDLDALPGIGPVLAQRIIDYRSAEGGFKTLEELKEVSGIGEAKYRSVKNLIRL